jgi:acid phosphatase
MFFRQDSNLTQDKTSDLDFRGKQPATMKKLSFSMQRDLGLAILKKCLWERFEPMKSHFWCFLLLPCVAVLESACGGGSSSTTTTNNTATNSTTFPSFSHVFIVVEENHSYGDVIENTAMPYFNGLAASYGLATQFYGNAHPSLPNYFELTAGEGTSITGMAGDSYPGPVTQDNVVRTLMTAGKTWKSYAESLPTIGYLGGDSGAYVKRHNPFAYLSDVINDPKQASNIVLFSQLATNIANGSVPNFALVIPNINDDAHDCPAGMSSCTDVQKLAAADQWLRSNIDPVIKSSVFQDSLIVITFDEGAFTDLSNGGGHVAALIVSPKSKTGYQSTTFYQHQSLLRLSLKALGVTHLFGDATSAPDMGEFFR